MNQKAVTEEIQAIKQRNMRVAADKAWETSMLRRLCITGMTYIVAVLFMWSINVPNYLLNTCVPTGGYVRSTLSLPVIKKWWITKI